MVHALLSNCYNRDDVKIKVKKNTLKCGSTSIALPTYEHIPTTIKNLAAKQKELKKQYFYMYNNLLNGDNISKTAFDELVKKIRDVDKEIETHLLQTYDEKKFNEYQTLNQLAANLDEESAAVRSKSIYDPSVSTRLCNIFKQKLQIMTDLNKKNKSFYKDYVTTESYRGDLREQTNSDKTDKPKKEKVAKKYNNKQSDIPDIVAKKRILKKVPDLISVNEQQKIKQRIKELLKETYRFKDKSECSSNKRSQPYYTTKEDILKEIETKPELKKLMPDNYKKLTKEKLCEYFFD